MLKMHEIRELIKLVDQSKITEFEYEFEGLKISIKKDEQQEVQPAQNVTPAPPEAQRPADPVEVKEKPDVSPQPAREEHAQPKKAQEEEKDTSGLHKIVSPMVGTFYRAPAPDAEPYVKEGDKVTENTVVCIVEAMKLMNEIEAEVRGEIVEVLAENGQLVEYGQPLFLVKPE
ncbi:acetyl-CoA carboxylase biotin carboxyl carrier protein [Caldalkalibacillus thermarum TA2.A1]|uniref:Biotin carboxyl carrier protein of acetyl-CoA carboxylase n=1 Tax=Caldalkalibacillus thermarum (strain TA2.A1) TaxID=986075 RepID=A0A8X8I7Z7_CALTT|nr:acetyl-CoA carboxylase biotin carboxyl carrier protein [Caldalkalibacillus thermarum]QZT35382.1 acetyl-CoA carboxylase biotin carboxyl carrier protein [Caldalkalibacillus thermarum TA2.A1]GGK19055.1 biotin carboxyl carrier protein of acetyl-CoA carboxylase [Caldalkalibacillus thermarum]